MQTCPVTLQRQIGKGGYGTVHRGLYEGKQVAVKLTCSSESKNPCSTFGVCNPAEIDIMRRLRHPHLLCMIDFLVPCEEDPCQLGGVAIIMELHPYSLPELNKSPYYKFLALHMLQISSALKFLHSNGVLHLDVKPDNMLVNHSNEAKLADFGLCSYTTQGEVRSQKLKGSIKYLAPEIWLPREPGRRVYTEKSEVWALGVTIIELCNRYPFNLEIVKNKRNGKAVAAHLSKSDRCRREFVRIACGREDFTPLLYCMLDPNPQTRCSLDQVISYLGDMTGMSGVILGESLQPSQSLQPLQLHGDTEKLLDSIRYVTDICLNQRAELLFLAIDLLYRSQKRDTVSALACYKIASGLLGKTQELEDTVIKRELELVKYLDGILYRKYLFHSCSTLEQLRSGYSIILHPENYLNPGSWVLPGGGTAVTYDTKCSELF